MNGAVISKLPDRFAGDLNLNALFQYPKHDPFERKESTRVFLTGATGFLGVFLLHELLTRYVVREVVCLVRAKNDDCAREKVLQTLSVHQLSLGPLLDRIRAVAGDISKPWFGLAPEQFEYFGQRVDTIFHCAAQINLILPYRSIRAANVVGTSEVLRFATISPGKQFHHISSVAVLGSASEHGSAEESGTFRVPYHNGLTPGYTQSKWVGEQLVNSAADNGLHASIFRPGLITGHSEIGVCNVRDAFSLMLSACIQLGLAPDSGSPVYMTPVDYVSRAILQLTQLESCSGRAFHVMNPCALSWQEISTALTERGYVRRTLPYREWVACVRAAATTDPDDGLTLLSCILPNSPPPEADRAGSVDIAAKAPQHLNHHSDLCYVDDNVKLLLTYCDWLASHVVKRSPRELVSCE